MLYLVYRWFGAKVTARKDFLLPFVAFYRWFCACGVTVGANLWLEVHFLVFERLRTPVTVEADILSSLIVFDNRFCKMTKMTFRAIALSSNRKRTTNTRNVIFTVAILPSYYQLVWFQINFSCFAFTMTWHRSFFKNCVSILLKLTYQR